MSERWLKQSIDKTPGEERRARLRDKTMRLIDGDRKAMIRPHITIEQRDDFDRVWICASAAYRGISEVVARGFCPSAALRVWACKMRAWPYSAELEKSYLPAKTGRGQSAHPGLWPAA